MKFGGMVVLTILDTLKKESGKKDLRLGSYYSFNFLGDLLRALQSKIWSTKQPFKGLKNGGRENLVHRSVERFTSFLEM